MTEQANQKHAAARGPRPQMPVVAVVLAAGFGTRLDPGHPKQLLEVGGKAVISWSVEAFERHPAVTDIVVVVNPQVRAQIEGLLGSCTKLRMVISGGSNRADSTVEALQALASAGIPEEAKILIHDAVRPFVNARTIDACIEALDEFNAATAAVKSTDTVLLGRDLGEGTVVGSVPDRGRTFRAQTPQAFRFHTIRSAYDRAAHDPDFQATDDTRAVLEFMPDEMVTIVAGDETNIKITRPEDLLYAERIAESLDGRDVKRQAMEEMHQMLASALGQ
ncbi:MAG: 2-C-methyl-D-erythritol 4-phosphate cytidylyltransferase [Bifidobacterium psychraerophilum]|uniref:2-C-methyl-D-erythritol 4-phosphate cytidylyltransferase n=1 Tax=Bifidobacterium psychraerophilum TaxID=218140 RepID=UPI0039EC7799